MTIIPLKMLISFFTEGESAVDSALAFSQQSRESFWQDWMVKPRSHTCLAVAAADFSTRRFWHAELVVFVKVLIFEMLIY